MRKLRPKGLVRVEHHLSYGHGFGFGVVRGRQIVPLALLRAIVDVANPVLCALLGHTRYTPGECSACCKVTDPAARDAFRRELASLDADEDRATAEDGGGRRGRT